MLFGRLNFLAFGAIFLTASISAYSAPIALDLNGNHVWAGWTNLTSTAQAPLNYGTFPGVSAWPQPITSNLGTNSATINKASGNAYLGESSIYSGGTSPTPNTIGATFSVVEASPVASLKTLVFQLQIGESFGGYDLFNNSAPALFINGNALALQPNFTTLFNVADGGTSPVGDDPVFINTWGFQWDLSAFVGTINSFEIQFTTVQHAQVYGMQLDQTDAVYTAAVPEPSTYLLMGMAAVTLLILRKKRGVLRSS